MMSWLYLWFSKFEAKIDFRIYSESSSSFCFKALEKPKDTRAEPLTQDNRESQPSVEVTWDREDAAPSYEVSTTLFQASPMLTSKVF